MKRILLFVHYHKYSGLADHIVYLLRNIRHIYSRIVFISNSPISDENKTKLEGLYDGILLRGNKGFDFGAWKDAISQEGWPNLTEYDSVTLMDDTCFGPLFDLQTIYEDMEQTDADFWGMTIHLKTKNGMPGTDGEILEHIQSYFICFNNSVISSTVFQNFWNRVEYLTDINKVIRLYETQLTLSLSNAGFKYRALHRPLVQQDNTFDGTMFPYPDLLIQHGMPFVKVKSFRYFPYQKYIIKLMKEKTLYPVELIFKYVREMFDPNVSIQIFDKLIPAIKTPEFVLNSRVAIHLHVFYLDCFYSYVDYFNNFAFEFDLYITTDTPEKENHIRTYIKNTKTEKTLRKIILVENKGRDVLPWLSLADVLSKYDIVGKFHTKKSVALKNDWIGATWQQEFFELLLIPVTTIIDEFQKNQKIGIIIPEIPSCYRINPYLHSRSHYVALLEDIWRRMNCKKEINFSELPTMIFSYGTMFWYRPMALSSLFDLQLNRNDFPTEPLPPDASIAHVIERLPVYIAWNNGFDYRVMVFNPQKTSSFIDNLAANNVNNQIQELKNSLTYKLGHTFLFLPKIIRKLFRKYV